MDRISAIMDYTEDYKEKAWEWFQGVLILCGLEEDLERYELTEENLLTGGGKIQVVFTKK